MYVMYLLSYNFVEHRREAVKVGRIRNKRKYPFHTPDFLRISGLKIESFHLYDESKLVLTPLWNGNFHSLSFLLCWLPYLVIAHHRKILLC